MGLSPLCAGMTFAGGAIYTQRRLGSLPSRCCPTVSKCERRPWTCWVTVLMSRKRRSNGFASKMAVAPA